MIWAIHPSFPELVPCVLVLFSSIPLEISDVLCLPLIGNWQQRAAFSLRPRLKIKSQRSYLPACAWLLLLVFLLSIILVRHGLNALYQEYWDDCRPSSPETLKLGKPECDCKGTLCLKERKNGSLKTEA